MGKVPDKLPGSQKSTRQGGHDRFKGLFAKDPQQQQQNAATTPELAGRAPRQVVPQTPVTPEGGSATPATTTPSTTPSSGNESATPATKTPNSKPQDKKKKNKTKNSTKKAKWSHVPSASDGDSTHFENFENEGAAQPAVARMKTRALQWSRETTTTEAGGGGGTGATIDEDVGGETDAGESFRQEGVDGSSGGSELPPLERTQEDGGATRREARDEGRTQDEVGERPLLSPQPSPPKAAPPAKEAKEVAQPKEPAKAAAAAAAPAAPARSPTLQQQQKPTTAKSPLKLAKSSPKPAKPKGEPAAKPAAAAAATAQPAAAPAAATKPAALRPGENTRRDKRDKTARKKVRPPAARKSEVSSNNNTTSNTTTNNSGGGSLEDVAGTTATARTSKENRPQTTVRKQQQPQEEPQTPNYRQAVKLMKLFKRNNYLENALRFEDSEKVRKHFESAGFAAPPPPAITALLSKAIDFALETVLFRVDDLDTTITNEMRVFIIKKQEARQSMLEVLRHRPDLMPNKWGGARASRKRSKTSKSREGGGGKARGWFSSFFR